MNKIIITLLLLLTVSCGETQEPPKTDSSAGSEEATIEPLVWKEMNDEQRGAFMEQTVMPKMKALFQEFDPQEFSNFTCKTCHGPNAQEVGFHMPNGLAPLNPEHIPAMFQSEKPMAVFMTQKVWPQMTDLLGELPYNPETHEGFSCLHCHATQSAANEQTP